MKRAIAILATAGALSACANANSITLQRESEIYSSLQYDTVDCAALMRQRNDLAARHGFAPDAEREPLSESMVPGFGIILPDMRSAEVREKAHALGRVSAMNHSIGRRACGTPRS